MKLNLLRLVILITALLLGMNIFAQLKGKVFLDYNNNGIKENTATYDEPYLAGVIVKAYNASNFLVGIAITNNSGPYNYTLVGFMVSGALRIEFSSLPSTMSPGLIGADNRTNTQFVTAGATNVDFAAVNNTSYSSTANAQIFVPHHYGRSQSEMDAGTFPDAATDSNRISKAIYMFNEANSGTAPLPTVVARFGQVGTIWGLAFHKRSKTLFAASFYRKYGAFGPGGQSAIYKIRPGADGDFGTADDEISPYIKLDDYFGANSTGISPFSAANPNGDSYYVGRIAYGDIEVSTDGTTLMAVNLADRKIYKIPITNDLSAPALGTITASPAYPTGLRPFAVKQNSKDGKIYVGAVNETTSSLWVWGYNNLTNTWDAMQSFFAFPNWKCCPGFWGNVDYTRGYMLTGIEFNLTDNRLVIDCVSRDTYTDGERNVGDIIAASWNGLGWTLENKGVLGTGASALTGSKISGESGPGATGPISVDGGEFYDDNGIDGADNQIEGALLQLPGRTNIATTFDDPFTVYTGGVRWLDNNNGSVKDQYQVTPAMYAYPPKVFQFDAKRANLGDLECLLEEQPIQIGNRIWLDVNSNGVQDADETAAGVAAGTTVTLRSPGVDGVYGNADDKLWFTTTDAAGNYYFDNLSGGDSRKSAAWAGIGDRILPGYEYRIEVDLPSSLMLTIKNATNDEIDSDASMLPSTSKAVINVVADYTRYNYDFGVTANPLPVKLISFTGTKKVEGNLLEWKTAYEENLDRYEIEQSANGVEYNKIATVTAKNNNSSINNVYSFVDKQPAPSINYYRLKMMDIDGKYEYSSIITINNQLSSMRLIAVYPLPFNDFCNVNFTAEKATSVTISIYDMAGKFVMKKIATAIKGENIVSLNGLGGLAPGVYMLELKNSDMKFHTKILKTN